MTGCDHENSAIIEEAAQWLAKEIGWGHLKPFENTLMERFPLTFAEAELAVARSREIVGHNLSRRT